PGATSSATRRRPVRASSPTRWSSTGRPVATVALPSDAGSTRTPVCVPGTRAGYPLGRSYDFKRWASWPMDTRLRELYRRARVMRLWGRLSWGCALALIAAPGALAARPVSVGYDSPEALRGLHVLATIGPLHVAEVSAADAGALRDRPGIRSGDRTGARHPLGVPLVTAGRRAATAEWQFTATRANLVPADVQRAASSITIAVVDTGADLSAPAIAAKAPTTYNAVTGTSDVSDVTGHGTFVASV